MTGRILERDSNLRLVVERLVGAYKPDRIYLFGSIARGDQGADSDYDLMVIVPDDAPPERRGSRLAYQALRGTGIAADVVVWTRDRFDRRTRVIAGYGHARRSACPCRLTRSSSPRRGRGSSGLSATWRQRP